MITEIGIVSGQILMLLEGTQRRLLLQDIAPLLEKPDSIILMSIGWLIREGMIKGEMCNHYFFISLNKNKEATGSCPGNVAVA